MKKLVIVGRSRAERENMASVVANGCVRHKIPHAQVEGAPFPDSFILPDDSVVIYVSSKERFPSVLEECQKRELVLIVASSGIEIPDGVTIPVIKAPNLALLILALFDVLPRFGQLAQILNARTLIAEAHQATKTSAPITAQTMAGWFGVAPETLGSVRSDTLAEILLGIPTGNVGGFACHFLETVAGGVKVTIKTEILGREAYFLGLKMILAKVEELGPNLTNGIHDAHKLVFPQDPFQQELVQTNKALEKQLEALREELQARVPERNI